MNTDVWNDKDLLINEEHEQKFIKQKRKELIKAEDRRRKAELDEIKNLHKEVTEEKKHITTTKILIYFILVNCTIVEAYSMIVMYKLADLSALYSLIGAVIGEAISYAVYCAKSFKETNAQETLNFEREKLGLTELTEEEENALDNIIADDVPEDDDHSGDIPADAEFTDENILNEE